MRRLSRRQAVALIPLLGVVVLELALRTVLGTTPLSVSHPTIEYLFAPNQETKRFGNRVLINEHSMRSAPIPPQKLADEMRVLVLGDSVVNGGNTVDQEKLATEVLRRALANETKQRITMMNVSAGSWGAPNLLAYVQEKGFFDADIAILVLSTHDHKDAPTFAPLNPLTHPTKQAAFAIPEALQRYLPQLLARSQPSDALEGGASGDETAVSQSLSALAQLGELVKEEGIPFIFILHPSRLETDAGRYEPEARLLTDVLSTSDARIFEALPEYVAAETRGKNVFRDKIHLTPEGHEVLGGLMQKAVYDALAK